MTWPSFPITFGITERAPGSVPCPPDCRWEGSVDGIIPMFEVVTANGGRVLGGFDLACAVQVARQVELGGSLTLVRIVHCSQCRAGVRRASACLGIGLLLRQEKSWKGEWKRNLKPFEAIQRVRPPPGRGAARQPEASLAWETATSLVKRRQQMLKPCVSLEIEYPLGPSVWVSRGRCRQDR